MDLSARAKFRLTGTDRVRYLNGQVTNDVRKASKDTALHACVVNAKGRIEAEVFIHVSPDGEALMLDAQAGLRDLIAARLERYIVADDVLLEDVTEEWSVLHCFAGRGQDAGTREVGPDAIPISCSRVGVPGMDLWRRGGGAETTAHRDMLSNEETETLRILRGIPRWPQELNPEAFPQEAGLEAAVMDFAKGCYIGQEVLSRIKMSGKVPKRLVRFVVQGSAFQVEEGMKLMTGTEAATAKEAGVITSVTRHPLLDQWVGLAYVRPAFEAVESLLLANGDPPRLLGDAKITSS